MTLFDGFRALAVEQPNAVSEPVRFESPAVEPGAAAPPRVEPPPEPHSTPSPAPAATPSAKVGTPESVREPKAVTPAVMPPQQRIATVSSEEALAREDPGPERRRGRPYAAWVAASVLAALVLLVQLAYAFRGELAARSTAVRSMVAHVCEAAGCSVPLPHRPELLRIEASDVHMVDANRPQLIQLTATLRSYAGYHLAYPALDLVLTNANEHALARRIFIPQEYLDAGKDPKGGLPPRAEITIALDLDTGDLNAAGFRLDLLAAP